MIKQRQSDPVQFSLASGQAKPIDMSNKDNFGQSVALRAAQVSDLAKSYGTPLTFFSKDEANQIGVFFRDAPVSQQAAYLDTIRQSTGGGQVYMSALQQISANAPSAAVAGILMDKPGGILAEKTGLILMFPCLLKPQRRQFLLVRRLVKVLMTRKVFRCLKMLISALSFLTW